jgi:integrase
MVPWNERRLLMNNWLRRFKTMCKRAKLSIHELRHSCITNWARSADSQWRVRRHSGITMMAPQSPLVWGSTEASESAA